MDYPTEFVTLEGLQKFAGMDEFSSRKRFVRATADSGYRISTNKGALTIANCGFKVRRGKK